MNNLKTILTSIFIRAPFMYGIMKKDITVTTDSSYYMPFQTSIKQSCNEPKKTL